MPETDIAARHYGIRSRPSMMLRILRTTENTSYRWEVRDRARQDKEDGEPMFVCSCGPTQRFLTPEAALEDARLLFPEPRWWERL